MEKLMLSEIIKSINAACPLDEDIEITGVSTDTRTIQKGDLFIALSGEKFDAHDYIDVAEKNGAVAAVCSREVEAGIPMLYVDDTLLALHSLAAYYREKLGIKVVGVTGSNGKTTTRDMTAAVLRSKYSVYSTAKNFNNEIGLPKSVLELDESYDIAVLEMGMNHLGEISRLTDIAKPDAALITNVGMAHIGNLGSQENILKAKLEILEGIKKDGLIVLNGDDALLRGADTKGIKKAYIGIGEDTEKDLYAKDIEARDGCTYFTAVYDGEEYRGYIPVLGNYNVSNALEAMRIGVHFGVTVDEAFSALEKYRTVKMRQEAELVGGVKLVKDYYNASPDSARVALETLSIHAGTGKRIAVLGEMLELGEFGEKAHYDLGEMCVKNGVDYAFFIGKDCEEFKRGMPDNSEVFSADEREELENALRRFVESGRLSEGDAILIKGSRGMKMEQFYEVLKSIL